MNSLDFSKFSIPVTKAFKQTAAEMDPGSRKDLWLKVQEISIANFEQGIIKQVIPGCIFYLRLPEDMVTFLRTNLWSSEPLSSDFVQKVIAEFVKAPSFTPIKLDLKDYLNILPRILRARPVFVEELKVKHQILDVIALNDVDPYAPFEVFTICDPTANFVSNTIKFIASIRVQLMTYQDLFASITHRISPSETGGYDLFIEDSLRQRIETLQAENGDFDIYLDLKGECGALDPNLNLPSHEVVALVKRFFPRPHPTSSAASAAVVTPSKTE